MRKWFAFVFSLTLLALAQPLAASTASAANELQVSVRTGFDGQIRPGTWAPVEIALANAGPNLSGNVQLSVQRRAQGQNTFGAAASIEYTVPVAIPEHSSKRFTTAVFFPPFFDQLQVQLVSGRQLLYKDTVALQRIDPSAVSCGVLATDPSAFDSLTGLTVSDGRRQPHVAYLDLPDLPTNPQLLGGLDCLIISDYSTRGLTAMQQSALTAWVNNGGMLTIGTGPAGDSALAGLPADLLPATASGTFTLRSLGNLESYFGSTAHPTGPWLATQLKVGDGAVVVADESQPLLVAGRRGKGTVFVLALSLTQKPLLGWDGLDSLWGFVLSYVQVPTAAVSSFFRQDSGWGRIPREALTRGGSGVGPEAQWLLAALALFGLLVGPFNLIVLSRLGRRELALITVPVLTVLATVGAMLFADNHRQGDLVVNQVSIVRTWTGSGIGQTRSFIGIFALHPQSYRLAVPANTLLANSFIPNPSSNSNSANRAITIVHVLDTGSPEIQGLDLEPGALSSVTVDGHTRESGKIQGTIGFDGDTLSGQIVNGFSSTIQDASIVAGNTVQSIGDLPPGTSHAFTIHVDGSPVGFRDPTQIVDRLSPVGSHEPNVRHDVKFDILTAALSSSANAGGSVELSGLSLVGWIGTSPNPIADPVTGREAHQQTLFITNLPIQVSDKMQTLPVPLVDRQQLSSSYSARVEAGGISVNSGDVAAFQFTTPVDPAHFALRSLTLATNADAAFPGTLEFFNWRTQTWDNVPFAVGNLSIPNPERYYSATGSVRVRFRYRSVPMAGPASVTFTRFQLLVGGAAR